jgi:hypothetical protein
MINVNKTLVGKPEAKRLLGRRLEDNIKTGLKNDVTMWTEFMWLRFRPSG